MSVRILHIVGDSKFGGASLGILRLAKYWQSVGWEVEVLATDPVFRSEAQAKGVPTVPLDVIWREIRPLKDLLGLWRLVSYLKREPYAIVHTHTTKAGFVGRLAAWFAGVPVVVHTSHGFAFHESSPWWKIAGYVVLERIASWGCQRVVAVSLFHARWGARLGMAKADKFLTIRNGVPDQKPPSDGQVAAIRSEWSVRDGEVVLLTPGRLAAEKGLEDMVEALTMLKRSGHAHFRWMIAGEGPLRGRLEELVAAAGIEDRVVFLGFRDDISLLLAAADLVVFPSWREGLSIALLEAMAAARPIITTSIGSNREVTREGQAAVLVKPGDVKGLSSAIFELSVDEGRRAALAARARAEYTQEFSNDRMLAEYHQLYKNLLEERRSEEPFSTLLSS
ncbi:MAG: glycosyltransferase family 4 protein [Bryobacteraceae bacterium]|nr:glycosyltransferase family 4 protein [Bryobacteraceae bacterium]